MRKTIERVVAVLDERLLAKQFYEESRRQADAMPLTIVEDGIPYEIVDVRCEIKGHINTAIGMYQANVEVS